MFEWLFGKRIASGKHKVRGGTRRVNARYDGAQPIPEEDRYWSAADHLSADAANSSPIRATLRSRSRYECGNGPYANAIVKTKAYELVGRGPRLQMLTDDPVTNATLEAEWRRWSRQTRFAKTLRVAVKCRVRDGESVGLITTNHQLTTLAKVQLRLYECDRLTTPDLTLGLAPNRIDGIDFDAEGNPEWYWLLDAHPGSGSGIGGLRATRYPAARVIHWFDVERAEQHRGIPELTPSLRRFGPHRRFLHATIRAAETAAEIAVVLQTNQVADTSDDLTGSADERLVEPMDEVDLNWGGALIAPDNYTAAQIEPKQPATTYGEFNESLVTEEARPLLMPANIATGSSAKYNYASGRLDNQLFDYANTIERDDLEIEIVDRVTEEWLRETLSEMSAIAPSDVDLSDYPYAFIWDSRGHVDPAKEASADDMRLKNGSTTLPAIWAAVGKDWRDELAQQAAALGITVPDLQKLLVEQLYRGGNAAPPMTQQSSAGENNPAYSGND